MRTTNLFLVSIFITLLTYFNISNAEDIDLYSGLSGTANVPNVLMVMDTGANFSGSASPGCTAYASGGAPSLGTNTNAGVEQCALVDAIDALPVGTVNIGLMVYNANNFTSGAASGVGPCVGSVGGCLVKPLTLMDAAGKSALINFIKTWTSSGSNSTTAFNVKTNNEKTASAMQEAWAYYNGKIGMSGMNYATSIVGAGCQKNFIIFIGNSFSNSGGPGDPTPDPGATNTSVGLGSTQVGATDAQKVKLTDTIKFASSTCGVTQLAAGSAASDWSNNWLDEWARYMHDTDASSTLSSTQNITTYTIGVINNGTNSCKPDYPALLTNTAKYGGGKYFQTGSSTEVKQAILKILNEVQAVNSVFASSSLPVSVNTQGTFANQVFIGMFRPDAAGNPRWLGNLKQYQFVLDASGNASLGDSLGNSAISSAGTGFISPNAVSFWTCGGASTDPNKRTCSPVADPSGGFWANLPQSVGGAYDLEDGELVEKGGAGQMLRLANLTDDYTTTAGSTTNPRKLYTYCPSGASCVAALSNSANAFSTANVSVTGINANSFGSSTTANVSSIVRTGTTAVVTTVGSHGFSNADSILLSHAAQSDYNNTFTISSVGTNTFTISGLPDYPTTPAQGAYTASTHNAVSQTLSSLTRTSAATGSGSFSQGCTPNLNCETATASFSSAHGFSNGASVTVTGAQQSDFNGTFNISTSGPASTTFTYSVPIYPVTPSTNVYKVVIQPYTVNVSSVTSGSTTSTTVTTSGTHGFHVGQTILLSGIVGTSGNKNACSAYNTTQTIVSIPSTSTFTFTGTKTTTCTASTGTVSPDTTGLSVAAGNISRATTGLTATATVSGVTAGYFAYGDKVNITKSSGTGTNESAYAVSPATISCTSSPANTAGAACTGTTFTYSVTTTPAFPATTATTLQAATSTASFSIPATKITRSGTTATVTGVTNAFTSGTSVDISASGTAYANESAYTGTWTITCPVTCSTAFTFGPVTQTPTTPATVATGSTSITAYRGSTPPDSTTLINWVRGQDNAGDEFGPGGTVTVRPSIHGDVLHSRPVVINYGGTTGVVAFYGANDGVFRAVNANQTTAIGSIPAGGELWGFIPTEFFSKLNRQRTNSPVLKLSSTPSGIDPTPQTKDYFADGSTGVYQEVDATGNTTTADIFITMRRGGGIMYALDVCNQVSGVCTGPTSPAFLWKIDNTTTGFSELGQTWSRPKTAKLKGYVDATGKSKAVLIFGAGYDTAQDSEPPGTDSSGRGIYIVDAATGALVWSATHTSNSTSSCSGTVTQATCQVAGMDYSIPADISLIDKDGDGLVDRLYAVDMGGNIWRIDLQPTAGNTPDHWQINKLAALGCTTGVCGSGSTPRKFFYQPDLVPASGYDAVLVGSGDREHPLLGNAANSIINRFYVLSDAKTGNDGSGQTTITESTLFDASRATYNGTLSNGTTPANGFYITLATGEKVVNAASTVAGQSFFGTNQPVTPSVNSCDTNLGISRGYLISPYSGNGSFSAFDGGGLPPTPVYGLVEIARVDAQGNAVLDNNGNPIMDDVPFCIGCGGRGGASAGVGIGDKDASNNDTSNGNLGGCVADQTAAGCIKHVDNNGDLPPECGAVSSLEACKAIIDASTDRHRTYWYMDKDQ